MRPGPSVNYPPHLLPVAEIKPAVEEAWAGFFAMSMEIKNEFVQGTLG